MQLKTSTGFVPLSARLQVGRAFQSDDDIDKNDRRTELSRIEINEHGFVEWESYELIVAEINREWNAVLQERDGCDLNNCTRLIYYVTKLHDID